MCQAERTVHIIIILSVLTAVRDHIFILETLRHVQVVSIGPLHSSSLRLENLTATL